VEAVKQAPVSWFGTQVVELGIADCDNPHHALGKRLLEVIERGVVISETGEGDGQIVRRDVGVARALNQIGQQSRGASHIASTRAGVTQR